MKDSIGITTTIPGEVVFAAGLRPVDLNNIFITSSNPLQLVEQAERSGFPSNMCCWIKGIYAAAHQQQIRKVVGVVQGDCSNTHALMEIWQTEGVEVVEFAYPYNRSRQALEAEISRFCAVFGTTVAEAESVRQRLAPIRARALEIDRLCWQEGKATGEESHLFTISCSDFNSDYEEFGADLAETIGQINGRKATSPRIRLGLVGIPPICAGLYELVREYDAEIVFNEMQRQFAMPFPSDCLTDQYQQYLYPYDVFARIEDIHTEMERRRLDGIIHYVQSFCFRQLHDRVLRERLDAPILTLECDRPGPLDGSSRTRIEAFIEMVAARKHKGSPQRHRIA